MTSSEQSALKVSIVHKVDYVVDPVHVGFLCDVDLLCKKVNCNYSCVQYCVNFQSEHIGCNPGDGNHVR